MTAENGRGILSREEVLAQGRKTVDLPSGGRVIIGRIDPDELVEILGGLPDVSALAAARDEGVAGVGRRPEVKVILKSIAAVVLKGTILPELCEKRKDGPTPLDFTIDDRLAIYTAILELSSYSKKAGGEVLPLSETAS